MKARFDSRCSLCGTPVLAGSEISKHGNKGWIHSNCAPSGDRADDRQYRKGRGEGHLYSQEVKVYGQPLADAWEMDAEMARYNSGED